MKKLIFGLAFIYCVICLAHNVENRNTGDCKGDADGPSDCVDLNLIADDNLYYDKCCFYRYRKAGSMVSTCMGVNRQQFIDIPEYIERLEKIDPNLKVYELNCNSSYLKIFALGFALFSLLF